MKKYFQFILLLVVSLGMNSCYYDAYEEELIEIDDELEAISYQNDIIPLWSQCVGCHKGDEPPDLRDNVSYNDLINGFVEPGNSEASILYKSLLGTDGVSLMPPGSKWPDSKINLVKNWIDQGAKNN